MVSTLVASVRRRSGTPPALAITFGSNPQSLSDGLKTLTLACWLGLSTHREASSGDFTIGDSRREPEVGSEPPPLFAILIC